MLSAVAIDDVFKEKRLSLIVRDAAILQTHERHQLTIFVYRSLPAIKLAAFLQLFDVRTKVREITLQH